ncbi:MAG: hypothetical protein IKD70_00375 [Eggerthellaceae bacterium]|nr:hypothetical protein [Eggerthellaceae bacterium]
MRRLIPAILFLIVALCCIPATAFANTDIPAVTITLQAGDGTGSPITISSRDEGRYYGESPNGLGVGEGQFFLMDGELWFCAPGCPNTFKAPDGYVFLRWNGAYAPGDSLQVTDDTTLTATWMLDSSQLVLASYSLTPAAYTLCGSGYTDIPCTLTSLVLGKVFRPNYSGGWFDMDGIAFVTDDGVLADEKGRSIPFLVDDQSHSNPREDPVTLYNGAWPGFTEAGQTFAMPVYISADDFDNAVPGTYTGELEFIPLWGNESGVYVEAEPGHITLTLVVPGGSESYTLTLSVYPEGAGSVTGGGTFLDKDTVSISATPNGGYRFVKWTYADGTDFAGSRDYSFMIRDDIELVANFEEYTPSSYTLEMPASIAVTPNAQTTAFTVGVSALDLRPNADGKTPKSLRVKISAGTLVNRSDSEETLPFKVNTFDSTLGAGDIVYLAFDSVKSTPIYIVITDSQWAAASPGVYTGSITYQPYYIYPDSSTEWLETLTSIPVTLTIPGAGVFSYVNTSGGGSVWNDGDGDLAFIFTRTVDEAETFSHFTGIKVDGQAVDSSDYTAESGSVVVTLKATYLETLSAGDHTLSAMFDDGEDATADFSVVRDTPNNGTGGNAGTGGNETGPVIPQTGDGSPIDRYLALMTISLLAALVCLFTRRRVGKQKS